jgi:hypothetical protein
MKRSVWIWQLMGFALTSLLGTVLHFLFDLFDGALWIAPFSGVNESTFEHMKLFFWPAFIFAVFQSFFFSNRQDFFTVKLKGITLGLVLIPIIFYTYNGVIGKSADWFNIAIFFICAAAAFVYEWRLLIKEDKKPRMPFAAFAALCIIGTLFVIFTFFTPTLEIFKDPLTGGYGI